MVSDEDGTTTDDPVASVGRVRDQRPTLMLLLATVGFALTFWAWALLAPLGPMLRQELGLTSFEQSLIVAVPVIVGSIGRIPVGALTDRFGARRMFPAVAGLTILPVLYVGHLADSFVGILLGGFFLGIAGTSFAVGVPFVNAWYPPLRRGLAVGIFGAGMGGTAVSAFTTVQLAESFGTNVPFDIVAAVLAIYAVSAAVLLCDRHGRRAGGGSVLMRMVTTARSSVTTQLSVLYAVSFGGFVAFSVYLPTYLTAAFDLTRSDAALRTAGFVLLAVAARPVGGWLADRLRPVRVLVTCYAVTAALAVLASVELPLLPVGTVAFLGMAAMLGAGAGAVFALLAQLVPVTQVGSATGVVGAAGGLGGFFPPLVMGAIYGSIGDYTVGFLLLAATAAFAAVFTRVVTARYSRAPTGGATP